MSLDTGRNGRSSPAARPPRRAGRPTSKAAPAQETVTSSGREHPLPLVVAGALGGAGAAVLSLAALSLVTLTAWMLDPGADLSWGAMLEAAAAAFLAGQGVPLTINGVTVSLAPLGFGLLSVALIVIAARWAAAASAVGRRGEAFAVAVSFALAYGAVAALTAILARQVGAAPLVTFIVCAVIALLVAIMTVLRSTQQFPSDALPSYVRDALAGGTAAALLIGMGGAVLVLVTLLLHLPDVGLVLGSLNAGISGALLITVLTLGYLPVAIVWGSAYLLGPGFSVAANSLVGPLSDASSTTLPGLPLLAALPAEAPPFGFAMPLLAVAAGAVTGLLLRRRGHHGLHGLGIAVSSAAVAAVILAAAAWLASGGLGSDRLAALGPAPLAVGIAAFVTVGVGAAAVVPWRLRSSAATESADG